MAKKERRAPEYEIHTSQETDVIMRAASNGKRGDNWKENEQALSCAFEMPGLSHFVRLELTSEEQDAGMTLESLNELRSLQSSDTAFALLYISRLMATAQPTADNPTTNVWVSLDDIIAAVGLDPRGTLKRAEARRRVWSFLRFGEKARIVGQRSVPYYDKKTGAQIETYISAAPWGILGRQTAAQPSLFPDGEIPLRVQLAPSIEWMRLLLLPDTMQFLPMGEVLGAIPGAKPSGAWARVIGLALANFWRRDIRSALDGSRRATREDLLKHYPPSTGSVEELLAGPNPRYAVQYWAGALEILVECGFIRKEGEAALTFEQMRDSLRRQEWQEAWLEGEVDIRPGVEIQKCLEGLSGSLYVQPKRNLRKARHSRQK